MSTGNLKPSPSQAMAKTFTYKVYPVDGKLLPMCESYLATVIAYLKSVDPTDKPTNTFKKKDTVYFILTIAILSTFTSMRIIVFVLLFNEIYIILKHQLSLKDGMASDVTGFKELLVCFTVRNISEYFCF